MTLLNICIYFACAAIWLFRSVSGDSPADYVVTVIWFIGGIGWTIRYIKQKNVTKEKE